MIPIPTLHFICPSFSCNLYFQSQHSGSLFFLFLPLHFLTVIKSLHLLFILSDLSRTVWIFVSWSVEYQSVAHVHSVPVQAVARLAVMFSLFVVGLWRSQGKAFLPDWQKPGVSREIHRQKIPGHRDAQQQRKFNFMNQVCFSECYDVDACIMFSHVLD